MLVKKIISRKEKEMVNNFLWVVAIFLVYVVIYPVYFYGVGGFLIATFLMLLWALFLPAVTMAPPFAVFLGLLWVLITLPVLLLVALKRREPRRLRSRRIDKWARIVILVLAGIVFATFPSNSLNFLIEGGGILIDQEPINGGIEFLCSKFIFLLFIGFTWGFPLFLIFIIVNDDGLLDVPRSLRRFF